MRSALFHGVAHVARAAHAGHGPLRQRVDHGAVGVRRAGVERGARVATVAIETRLLARAVAIRRAANRCGRDERTEHVGLAGVAGRAVALRPVVHDPAEGGVWARTRVFAALGLTSEPMRTVLVGGALGSTARHVRVPVVFLGAVADGAVALSAAEGVLAAGVKRARVAAVFVHTRLRRRTVRVVPTSSNEADLVGVSAVAVRTGADGPVVLGVADGARAARVRGTRVHTQPLKTCPIVAAVTVDATLWLHGRHSRLFALVERITHETRGTRADSFVIFNFTNCISWATVLLNAGALTVAVKAGAVGRTVFVSSAREPRYRRSGLRFVGGSVTVDVSVSFEAFLTHTCGCVCGD